MVMKFGYSRVSTRDQNPNLQIDALKEAQCDEIFVDAISGSKSNRPELDRMVSKLREGDVVVIWKLDRLGRTLKDLIKFVEDFEKQGIGLVSIKDQIDTTTSHGKLIFNIFASLAEFERDVIRERTKAGLESARARGRVGGRRKGLSPEAENKTFAAETLYKQNKLTITEICEQLDISRRTLYNYLKHRGVEVGNHNRHSNAHL